MTTHIAHLYEAKSWVTLCGDETGRLMGKPQIGDKVEMCLECDRVSTARLALIAEQPYKTIVVPQGMFLAALRRYTDNRDYVFYNAQGCHPANIDAMMRDEFAWEPLFAKEK